MTNKKEDHTRTNKHCHNQLTGSKKTIRSCKMLVASIRQALQVLVQANKHADLHPEITLTVLPEPPQQNKQLSFLIPKPRGSQKR
jgi:hypothetical protein